MKQFLQTFKDSYIQTFDDTGKSRGEMVRVFPMSKYEEQKGKLSELNKSGAGVFFTPNPCSGGRKEENVTDIYWVYVDMDEGTKQEMRDLIKTCPIKPGIIIESKRGYHIYWHVKCIKPAFDKIMSGLIQYFNGDKAISSINEVLRFPGYIHMKNPSDPFKIKILKFSTEVFSAGNMIDAYQYIKPVEKKPTHSTPQHYDNIKKIPIRTVLDSLGVEINRSNFIVEGGEVTSASINEEKNYVNRFSGKEGSGSTIDVAMNYGNMELPDAIKYLKKLGGIDDIEIVLNQETVEENILQDRKMYTWGTNELNKKISPINEDTFIVFAGESGSGKTAFSFDMALKNSELGHKVLYLSLEMSTDAIFTRLAREYAGINKEQWRDRSMITNEQSKLFNKRKKDLSGKENLTAIGFQSGVAPTVDNIEGVIRKLKPDLVFIDNFDLIDKSSALSTYDNENNISKKLLGIAKGLPVPIVLVHHLKKGDDKDLNKPRNMNSLRGSGKIVHNADMVVLGFRPPFKDGMTDEELSKFTVIQLKDRDFGIGGYHVCYFNKGRFYDRPQVENFMSSYENAQDVFGTKD